MFGILKKGQKKNSIICKKKNVMNLTVQKTDVK